MTREETIKILMGMECSFPHFKIDPSKKQFTVDIWNDDLKDYEYQDIYNALKIFKATDTSGYAPTVGKLIEIVHKKLHSGEHLNEMQAWNMVYKAINTSDYTKAFNELPPLVQRVVGSPEALKYMGYDEKFNYGVEQSNFIKAYQAVCERADADSKIPSEVKTLISAAEHKQIGVSE